MTHMAPDTVIGNCPNCQHAVRADQKYIWCEGCNTELPQDILRRRIVGPGGVAPAPDVILTTAPSVEGYRITETIDIVTAECVFGMNIFRDMLAAIRDVVGGRSESTQAILREARQACLSELRREADSIGANAVIGVRLDYSEFSGAGKSMLFLVASGTAVRINRYE